MRWQTVSKEQHRKLPQAGRTTVRWQWFWFRNAAQDIRAAWRTRTTRYLRTAFYMRTRGANYGQVWIGPVTIIWPMRWLDGPARTLHPDAFETHRSDANTAADQEGGT